MIEQATVRWSVVIPAYAPGENLTITVASVLAAMAGRKDFEVVVVDDASPDPIVLDDFGSAVRVEHQRTNVGAVPNFNRAIDLAVGEFIHVLHADDYVEPEFYRALEQGLKRPHVVAAACGVHRVDGEGALIETMKPERATAGIWSNAFDRLAVTNRIPAPSIVVKRSTYDRVGLFDESLQHAADWDLWIRISQAGAIYYDPTPLAAYRVHAAQHTATLSQTAANIDEAIEVIKRLPRRNATTETDRLMGRAFLYRGVYAARTGGRAARARQFRPAVAQFAAAVRCGLLGVAQFSRLAVSRVRP